MAYNNGFPIGYQPMFYQNQPMIQQPQQQVQQTQNNGIIWVQGEAGAKSYLVAPNTTVQLWDSEEQVIYLKSADASGMPSMRVLDYKIRDNDVSRVGVNNNVEFATKADIEDLKKRIAEFEERFTLED